MEKTYSSTKQTHPLICAVCGVYERGARKAGSLAIRTIQPAVVRLEPHISAVNDMACKGLDRLEEKVPALWYPPEKLVTSLTEVVSSTVQKARDGASRPFASTSDRALRVASHGYALSRNTVSSSVDYVLNSAPVRLAGEGADTALTFAELMLNYILPASEYETEKEATWQQEPDNAPHTPEPGYKRVGTLAVTAYRRAYERASNQIQRTSSHGRDLALRIPGVPLLAGLARRNLEAAGGLVLSLQGSVAGLLRGSEQQSDKEKKMKKEGEVTVKFLTLEQGLDMDIVNKSWPGGIQGRAGVMWLVSNMIQSGGVWHLGSSLAQQIHGAYVTAVSRMKTAPGITFDLARGGTSTLQNMLAGVRTRLLQPVSLYGLFSRLSVKEGAGINSTNEGEKETTSVCLSQSTNRPSALQQRQDPSPASQGVKAPPNNLQSTQPSDGVCEQQVAEHIPGQQRLPLGGSGASAAPPKHELDQAQDEFSGSSSGTLVARTSPNMLDKKE